MLVSRSAALVAVVFVALSGCASDEPNDDGASLGPASISRIEALGDATLVSTPGNRIAEFMVARDPHDADHLVTAYGDYDSPGGVLNCAFSVSFDGGASWTVSEPVPGFSGPYLQFDGWVDFDKHGGVHAVCLRQAGPGATTEAWLYYFRSDDGGLTWSEAMQVPTEPPDRSTDKSVLAVGRDGTVYAAVSGLVARTSDNGTTWVPATPVDDGFAVLNGMVEDNAGNVYLLGLAGDVTVQRTADAGETWQPTTVGPFSIPPGYNDQNRWVDQRPWTALPVLAHDETTDDVWVAYQSWDDAAAAYRLHLYRSGDAGATYASVPVPAFSSSACAEPCHRTHPAIGFDLAGRIGMVVQLTQDGGHFKEVQFTASADHGATWLPPVVLSQTDGILMAGWSNPNALLPAPDNAGEIASGLAADPTTAHNVAAGIALSTAVSELQLRWNGEYWGLTAGTDGFAAMWIEHGPDGRPQLWSQVLVLA